MAPHQLTVPTVLTAATTTIAVAPTNCFFCWAERAGPACFALRAAAAGVVRLLALLAIRSGRSTYFSVMSASTTEITMMVMPEVKVISAPRSYESQSMSSGQCHRYRE